MRKDSLFARELCRYHWCISTSHLIYNLSASEKHLSGSWWTYRKSTLVLRILCFVVPCICYLTYFILFPSSPVPPDCWVFTWIFWPPSLCCSIRLQFWYLDFYPWWFLPPYYWRRHLSSGPLWTKRHSAIMMWPSFPLLSYPDWAQPFIVKLNSSQIVEAILSQQRPSLFPDCAFPCLKFQRHQFGPGDF